MTGKRTDVDRFLRRYRCLRLERRNLYRLATTRDGVEVARGATIGQVERNLSDVDYDDIADAVADSSDGWEGLPAALY